jgi:hypothetical protein
MRMLISLVGLYLVHRLLLHLYPAYRERVRQFDRKLIWVNIILLTYCIMNFLVIILRYITH